MSLSALLLFACCAGAAEPEGTLIGETWDAAYLDNAKAGFVHTIVRAVDADGAKILKTTMELDLTVKRFEETARLRMITGTDETPDGRVTAVLMRQFLGKEQQHLVTGTVDGDRLHVQADGRRPYAKDIPWNDQVIGLYRQERLYRERQVKPGDTFQYLTYEPTVTAVVRTRAAVKDFEEVEGPKGRGRQRLLRVEVATDKIMGVQLPPLTLWLDDNLKPVRSQVDMPGLGKLTLYRTSRGQALGQGGPVARVNVGYDQLIPINRRISRPYDTVSAVYRVTVKGDDEPATTFARDERQKVRNVRGNTFELQVRARPAPEHDEGSQKVGPEFLESCYFINSDDVKVRELARQAVGKETDPWARACRVADWVYHHIENKNFTENFATADHVARTLEGDCTEHSMLAAAMCRAVGVPSRTAVGLVYVDMPRGPVFGFHMWTEVWVRGRWVAIDATFGRHFVGATHLKVLDHSWHDVQSLTPLLPLVRVVGKASIEVVSVDGAE
jgi:hypothetical protein